MFTASARLRRYDIYVHAGSRADVRVDSVERVSTNPRWIRVDCFLLPRRRMDCLTPQDAINEARRIAIYKAGLPAAQMVLRGALAGGILAYATSLAMVVNAQGLPPIVAAICFPVGFVILVLLGLELATGNFALMPIGYSAATSPCPARCETGYGSTPGI